MLRDNADLIFAVFKNYKSGAQTTFRGKMVGVHPPTATLGGYFGRLAQCKCSASMLIAHRTIGFALCIGMEQT